MADFRKDQRGAALIEVTVVIPVVLAIGLGVMEFGNAIYSKHLITNGVRDAARYAAGLPQTQATHDDAQCIALTGKTNGSACTATATPSCTGANCRVSWWNNAATQVTVAYVPVNNDDGAGNKLYRGGATIPIVTVTATVPYQQLGFLAFFGLTAPTLSVSHEERVFGVR